MERWGQNRAEQGNEGNEGENVHGTCACGQMVEVYRDVDLVRRERKEYINDSAGQIRSRQGKVQQGNVGGHGLMEIYHGQSVK